jgi:hypothetical protein
VKSVFQIVLDGSFWLEDGALLSASNNPDATLVIPATINSESVSYHQPSSRAAEDEG